LDQSFKAGKADTAAEVLHNIRNAMTPLINGIERLTKSCAVGDTLRIAEVTKELADPDCPPERAGKLLQYVDASFKRMAEVRVSAADDLKLVASQARQVEAIVSDQEKFANVAPVAEDIPIDEVLSEAAHIIPKDDDRAVAVDIAGDLDSFSVHAHRVGLLQVMGNLILNAYESIQRDKKNSGEISLSASADVLDDKPMIRVTIRDNGNGFCSEVGPRIFERGFTSKPDGKANGLGLHWCANAVTSMGGRIFAESAGQGEGAEFHVLLPAAQGA
jgi:C4-dicarboxylate-specific signal transduction histidine kinase